MQRPMRKTRECQAPTTQANPAACHTLVFLPPQGKILNLIDRKKKDNGH
jgi:hypothetical protein